MAGDLESVGAGFAASISRPGGNLTGAFLDFPDFGQEMAGGSSERSHPARYQYWRVLGFDNGADELKAIEAAAVLVALGLKLKVIEVKVRTDLAPAFQSATQQGAGGLLMLSAPLIGGNVKMLAELALAHGLPAMTLFTDFARECGLMAYGPNLMTFFRQQGVMVATNLQGAKPAETPIQVGALILNLQTSNSLGLNIPASIQLRADEVIE